MQTGGRAYVYFGSSTGLSTIAAWIGSGDVNKASFGRSVAAAGDVNNDGFYDIIVGAYNHDAGVTNSKRGRAYVYFGSSTGPASTASWVGSGDENGALFGYSVATAGDVNGDGYSDIIVGAYYHDAGAGYGTNRGRAFVYFGSATGPVTTASWTGSGDEDDAFFGYSVATAGDVNGDGYSDIIVGAHEHDSGYANDSNRGRAYVYFGSSSGLP